MMNGQQPAVDGNMQIEVKLPLIQWQQLLQVMVDTPMPWKVTNPLITSIDRQIQDALHPAVEAAPLHESA